MNVIAIIGAGQLGSRYLQGLASLNLGSIIYIIDSSEDSINLSKLRYEEVKNKNINHIIKYSNFIEDLPSNIDIVIVATTANVRSRLVAQISKIANVRFWILEKVLTQSFQQLDELVSDTKKSLNTWVNHPLRIMSLYKKLGEKLNYDNKITMKVSGSNWGLACNGLHYIDLLSSWCNKKIVSFDNKDLNPDWISSKRAGFKELTGTMIFYFEGGHELHLTDLNNNENFTIHIKDDQQIWLIDEAEGIAKSSNGEIIQDKILFQSEITSVIVESILLNKKILLPTLSFSYDLHRIFFQAIINKMKIDDVLQIT